MYTRTRAVGVLVAAAALVLGTSFAAPQHAAADTLQIELTALGLSVQVDNGVVAATGPAIALQAACALGALTGDGAVALYSADDEQGHGVVVFIGDSDPAFTSFDAAGGASVNVENCTNEPVSIFYPQGSYGTGAKLDAAVPAAADENIAPTDEVACEQCSPPSGFTAANYQVNSSGSIVYYNSAGQVIGTSPNTTRIDNSG
jgi:hypothetical protein